jgi:hypothetical protein
MIVLIRAAASVAAAAALSGCAVGTTPASETSR